MLLSTQTYGRMTSTEPLIYIIETLADTSSYKSQEYKKTHDMQYYTYVFENPVYHYRYYAGD